MPLRSALSSWQVGIVMAASAEIPTLLLYSQDISEGPPDRLISVNEIMWDYGIRWFP